MKTAILCISDVYLERGRALKTFYESLGDQTIVLTPEYSHRFKRRLEESEHFDGVVYLPHRPYTRNLSYARLAGHYEFARSCRRYLESHQVDRVHCLVPANSLAMQMAVLKKEQPAVQLVFDVNDLWPESLPLKGLQHSWLFWPWKALRNKALPKADLVISECQLFAAQLTREGIDSRVVFWPGARAISLSQDSPWKENDPIVLAYLGSMNNIIDIPLIARIVSFLKTKRKVVLHLVGDGENRQALIDACADFAQVIDHGQVYDLNEKAAILQSCHFGLNVMKPDVKVGLSLKSLDYLWAGLPLINTLQGDTARLVEENRIGVNINGNQLEPALAMLAGLDFESWQGMRNRAWQCYGLHFTPEAFARAMIRALKERNLLNDHEQTVKKEDEDEYAS